MDRVGGLRRRRSDWDEKPYPTDVAPRSCYPAFAVVSTLCRPGRARLALGYEVGGHGCRPVVHLDSAGPSFDVGKHPLAVLPHPPAGGSSPPGGWREEGLKSVDASKGRVVPGPARRAGGFYRTRFLPRRTHALLHLRRDGPTRLAVEWDNGAAVFPGPLRGWRRREGQDGQQLPAAGLAPVE